MALHLLHHRLHHEHADSEQDPHSPRQGGFWWAHIGWVMQCQLDDTRYDKIKDLVKFPELMWLNRNPFLPALLFAALLLLTGFAFQIFSPESGITGAQLIVYGFFLSTVQFLMLGHKRRGSGPCGSTLLHRSWWWEAGRLWRAARRRDGCHLCHFLGLIYHCLQAFVQLSCRA